MVCGVGGGVCACGGVGVGGNGWNECRGQVDGWVSGVGGGRGG
jgi:hypothetical protein